MNRLQIERKIEQANEQRTYEPALGVNFEETVMFVAKAVAFESPLDLSKYPLELSVAAFSIKGGILDVFSTLIDHEDMKKNGLPDGCDFVAKQVTEENGLPPPGDPIYKRFSIGSADALLAHLESFMNNNNKSQKQPDGKRYLMALAEDMDDLTGSLEQLSVIAREKGNDDPGLSEFVESVVVLDLSKILYRCAKRVHAKRPEYNPHMVQFELVPLAENILTAARYNYKTPITCSYHTQESVVSKADRCSKNIVLRRAYLFLNEMMAGLRMEPTQRHLIDRFTSIHGVRSPREPEKFVSSPEGTPKLLESDLPEWYSGDLESGDLKHDFYSDDWGN